MRLALLIAVLTVALPNAAGRTPTTPEPVGAAVSGYALPLAGRAAVVGAFVAPKTRFGAGHRGVDLASRDGQEVHAAGSGTITFAGTVAGRGVVVIAHPDGVRTEYEPVAPLVRAGEPVAVGQLIATVHGAHRNCPTGGCLHWSARRDDVYFDPLLLLEPLGPVRLLPLHGSGPGVRPGVGLP